MYNCCHSSTEKKLISRIFSQHRLLGEKRKDTWIYEDKKMQRTLKKSPQNRGFIPAEACEAGRRDWAVFGVVDETTTTKFASRTCAVHFISLPVVVVLKFPYMYLNYFNSMDQILSGLVASVVYHLGSGFESHCFYVKFFSFKLKRLALSWTFPAWNII